MHKTSKIVRAARSLFAILGLLAGLPCASPSQAPGPQQLAFAGLHSVAQQGQFNAVATDSSGNLFLLLDQSDGVRLLKTDATATNILAQASLGAAGDQGLAMALDPSGNLYVTGQSTSGALSGTSGAAYVHPADASANSFIAKFNPSLTLQWVTFGGSGRAPASAIAATADAVFITGLIYGNGLPVTPGGIIQAPLEGSRQNGFVEKFSADGSALLYATYLSGAGGDTSPLVIAADAHDAAYVAGFTTAPGYPTTPPGFPGTYPALIPRYVGNAATTGFLTELTPAGDGLTLSTYIPGTGITSLAIDAAGNTLLLSGNIAPGQFPVASAATPMAAINYQVLFRMPLDGSSVLSSTILAPGNESYLTPGPNGTVWVDGPLSTPLLPSSSVSDIGTAFALRVSPQGTSGQTVVDEAFRFGGLASTNPSFAGVVTTLTSLAVDSAGSALIAGGVAPTASSSLLATQTFDLPLTNAPTTAFPSALRDAVVTAASCPNSSACAGSAAYLARVTPSDGASLTLSTDASPTILLRNLGSAQATGLQIAPSGFTETNTCGQALNSGQECTIVLSGAGPGTLTVSAANATTQVATLAAVPAGVTPQTLVFSPRELDFGIQTATSPAATRTITVTNLGASTATFTSALAASPTLNGHGVTPPYILAETSAGDCPVSGDVTVKQLAAGATCHITLSFTPSSLAANDGPIQADWKIGSGPTPGNVLLTAFGQAASLSLSSTTLDFGTQFYGGLTSPRFLYISNSSADTIAHTPVTSLSDPAFTVIDGCPAQLNPHTICQLQVVYTSAAATATDSATLALDQGLSVQVIGLTIPQPSVNGSTAPPSLSVSPTTSSFSTPVPVTAVSTATQTVTIQNTGTSSFGLVLSLTGDFTDQTGCTAVLAAGASCNVVLSFAPSQPGSRTGLLGVTAGSGTSPVYVTLSGTGTPILPPNNGTLDFGNIPVGQPAVQWYKVSQPFSTLTAATLNPNFKAVLVEDLGQGHGTPPSTAFLSATTGSCANCWLGLQFTPPAGGAQTTSLKLLSALGGNPYVLALTGNGLPPQGVTVTPTSASFGPIAAGSSSAPQSFTITNQTAGAISVSTPILSGDFVLSNANTGSPCTTLNPGASCIVAAAFAPTATGQRTGTLTVAAGGTSVSAALSGSGLPDPAVAFNPTALIFNNVPGPAATQQTITVSNTGSGPLTIGTPTNTSVAFGSSSACATLAPAATCTITVTYTPGAALAADTLQVPVTGTVGGSPVITNYPLALSATYTSATAGLQITPGIANVGPFPVDTIGGTRQFTVNNLTAKSLAVNVDLPREFLLAGAPCATLAPNGSCTFSATFIPVTAGDITGTLTVQGIPTDGSAPVGGIAFLEGFGTGTGTLAITGGTAFANNTVNFGQVASGQSARQTLTVTNTSTAGTVTIRRITSRYPFLASSTCGPTLAPSDTCAVTLAYTPLNQIATGAIIPPPATDTGTLTLESDALSSPDTLRLTGTGSPTAVPSPTGIAPTASFNASQNSLTFAPTAIGFLSAAQTVTLTNTGTSVLHIASITASPDFTVSSTCATVLPAATCTFTVAFDPQISAAAPGQRLGTVEIASDSSTPLEFLSLLGTAGASSLTLQPTSLNFGTVLLGTTTSLPLQLTNSSSSPVTFTGITAAGDYAVSGSCPTTLAPNASCPELVSFTPTTNGARPGTLSIVSSASTLPLIAQLSGTGAQTHLQLNPAALDFGNITQGVTAKLSLNLSNNSTTAAITGLAFTATGDFAVITPCNVTTLAPGANCSVTIAFTPAATGPRTGTLAVAGSDPASPLAVPLTGNGVTPVPPPGTGSFTLTASVPSATVASSYPASYILTVTPIGGFTGQVVLNCAALIAAQYASCSLQPSSVILGGTASQTASVTINTVTTAAVVQPSLRRLDGVTLCILAPAAFLFWRFRRSLPAQRWPLLLALLCTSLMLLVSGCGSSGTAVANLLKTPTGTYQYMVSASSTSGAAVSQSVTLSLVVQ